MGQEHNSTSYRKGQHFNWEERLILEKDMLTIKQIAIILDRHERSIRRELKRGSVTLQNSDLSAYMTYKNGSNGHKRHNRAKSAMKSISTRPAYIRERLPTADTGW